MTPIRTRLETPIGTLVVEAVAHVVVRCGTRLDLHDERYADDASAEARRRLDNVLEAWALLDSKQEGAKKTQVISVSYDDENRLATSWRQGTSR